MESPAATTTKSEKAPSRGSSPLHSIVQEESRPPKLTFPDGGRDAWMVILGCSLLSFTSYGQVNAFGVFTTYYVEHLARSPSDISWIGSMQIVLTYFSGLMFGRIFDAHGFRPLLIPGCLLSTFSLMMTSLSTKYYQVMLSHGIGLGLGIALQFYPLMALPSHWFYQKRALAVGIVVAGSSLAGIVYPIMLSRLFDSVGFPWAMRTMAFMNFAIQIVSIMLLKERLPRNMKLPLVDVKAFKEPVFMVYCTGGFFVAFGLFAPYWYIELYSLSKGLDVSFSFYTISIMNAGGLVGRVVTGLVADNMGKFNTLIPVVVLSGIWALALWIPASNVSAVVWFSLLFGFTSAAVSSLGVACTGQLTAHPMWIGARVGVFSLFMAPGILTGPSIAGAILSSNSEDYRGVQVFVGAMLLVSALFLLAARFMGMRQWGKF